MQTSFRRIQALSNFELHVGPKNFLLELLAMLICIIQYEHNLKVTACFYRPATCFLQIGPSHTSAVGQIQLDDTFAFQKRHFQFPLLKTLETSLLALLCAQVSIFRHNQCAAV